MAYDPAKAEDRLALGTKLVDTLKGKGFVEIAGAAHAERVFTFPVRGRAGMEVRVYTSVVGASVRPYAADAIRASLVYLHEGATRGLASDARVFRVGEIDAIVERTLERARNVYGQAAGIPRCRDCAAPTFTTKAGKRACAALCWTRRDK